MSVLSTILNLRDMDWVEEPSIGVEFDGLNITREPASVPAPIPGEIDLPPCGMPHAHHRTEKGMWSAGAWLCCLAQLERQDRKTITVNLRKSQKFASLRSTGSLTDHPVWLPFLAMETSTGTVYRRMLNGESFTAIAEELGVL